ncbi:hypothetical protein BCD64_00140 [Nostoc sp. MBR 210]|nr:hypothetical protein BCD64_00140 [Nostoc sp. MBR 210]
MNQSQVRLKNHITQNGKRCKRLTSALKTKFGVTLQDFDNAVNGDIEAAQKIGELARQGRLSSEFAPRLAQAYLEIIQGSEAYNKATAEILVQAGKSAIAIDKYVAQSMIANTKYEHQRKELAQQFSLDRKTENTRHQYQMNYAQMKGYIDAHIVSVDNQVSYLEQSNRPEIKQIAAEEQLDNKEMNEALTNGDKARFDLIPERNYTGGIKTKLLELKAALGF